MAKLLFENNIKKNKDQFITKVIEISEQLGIVPDWLMGIMNSESGLDSTIENSIGAVGLIQFMPRTAASLFFGAKNADNKSHQDQAKKMLKEMTNVQQLDYVFKYFAPFKGLYNGFEDLYLVAFYPNAGGKHGGTLSKPDDWEFPKIVATQNPGIFKNPNGLISIATFKSWAESKLTKAGKSSIKKKEQEVTQNNTNKKEPQQQTISKGYVIYIHTYSSITSLDDLIQYKGWRNQETQKAVTSSDIIGEEEGYKKENKESIRLTYTRKEDKEIQKGQEKDNLKIGTKLKIPAKFIQPEFVVFDGSQIIIPNDDTETFISEAMQKVVVSPEYRFKFNTGEKGKVRKSVPKLRVWIWCKSLGATNQPGLPKFSSKGEIFDLSAFIINFQTNVTATGGNFSFSLPPLTCECETNSWIIKKNTIRDFQSNKNNTNKSFVAKDNLHKVIARGEDKLKRNSFFFHNLISENDVIFIAIDSPETEPIEGLRKALLEQEYSNPKIDKSFLAGNFYDMIGLIDKNSVSFSSPNNSVAINISGRDCMKLLIEDSSYYLNIGEQGKQTEGIFKNDNPENWGRPLRTSQLNLTSPILALSIAQARTVGEMINFIFSSLASIEIAPDDLFQSYESQENGFGISRYSFFDQIDSTVKLFKAAGLWQIIKIQIDPENVNDRYVVDSTLPVHSGSLLNGIKIFIDDRFIEMISDTYLDQFFFIIRRPPYNKKSVLDYLSKLTLANSGLEIDDSEVVGENLEWYNGDVYCWYRINTSYISYGKQQYEISDIFPVVYFREYCEIWGNKALDVQSNYQPFEKIAPGKDYQGKGNRTVETQRYEDLAYLVESNAYLPFTRMGSITIKGDRRIKRGIWIRYKPTGEVFYVDSVSHSYAVSNNSIERTTTIQVSRGMVEYNDNNQYILPYYFKIINGLPNTEAQTKTPTEETTISDPIILNVYFDFDKDVLIILDRTDLSNQDLEKDSDVRKNLKQTSDKALEDLLADLRNDNNLSIKIIGHTDERGTQRYNLDLGDRRAKQIKQELIIRWNSRYPDKIDQSRIDTESKGESQPIDLGDPNNPITGRKTLANNRRIEVQYIKKSKKSAPNESSNSNNRENDFSKWKVNQEIFNFFLTRRQFCEKIEDLDNLGNYNTSNAPSQLITEEVIKNDVKDNNRLIKENQQQYIKAVVENPTVAGRYDELG